MLDWTAMRLIWFAPRVALDPRVWLIGALAVALLQLPGFPDWPPDSIPPLVRGPEEGLSPAPFSGWASAAFAEPLLTHVAPLRRLISAETWMGTAEALSQLVLCWLLWGLAGGIIAQLAAARMSRDEGASITAAARLTARRTAAYLVAPALLLCGIVALAAINWLLGLLCRVPFVGGVFCAVALCVSLALFILLAALVAGWPLMVVAVSWEKGDGFDAFSRSFSYLIDRIGRVALYASVALVSGTLFTLCAWFVAYAVIRLTAATTHLPAGEPAEELERWSMLVRYLAVGAIQGSFWCSATAVYLVLRRDCDATPIR